MIFREKVPYLIVSILLLLCSAYLLSEKTPFTGDEFYTLDIENIHKPIPYHGVVSQIIDTLSPITPENIFSLRFSSILFTLIGIILWHVSFLKDIRETIIFSILIITSSFLIRETIFFRYYYIIKYTFFI